MKRGTKTKIARGSKIESRPPIIQNIGGHLPHPPLDCLRPDFIIMDKGVMWIDLGICVNCPNRCKRRAEYIWELKRKQTEMLNKENKENAKDE